VKLLALLALLGPFELCLLLNWRTPMRSVLLAALLLTTPALAQTHPTTVGHPFAIFGNGAQVTLAANVKSSATATTSSGNLLTAVQNFSIADVQAAIADAQARNDTRHLPCWQAILPVVQSVGTPTAALHLPTAPGLAELAQTYFDDKAGLTSGSNNILDPIATGCALTLLDLQMGVNQLAVAIGLKLIPLTLPAGL